MEKRKIHGEEVKFPCFSSTSQNKEIALNYLTNASGGAERIAIESANRFHREGHAVTVIQCFGIAGEPYYQLDSAIPVIDLAVFPYKSLQNAF